MTECHRRRPRAVTVDHGQVRVAEARRLDLDQHLAIAGGIEVQFLDGQWPRVLVGAIHAHGIENGRAYLHPPPLAFFDTTASMTFQSNPDERRISFGSSF